jgi:hypothetical protein
MTHFLYLLAFALLVAIVWSCFIEGDLQKRIFYGLKVFVEFVGIGLILAWVFYFIPW